MDRNLGPALPTNPKFIHRKAPNFGDRVVRKILDPAGQLQLHFDKKGFYSCRKCISCRTVNIINSFNSGGAGNSFTIDEFITCNTTHVVYLLWCPCGLYYLGRTK